MKKFKSDELKDLAAKATLQPKEALLQIDEKKKNIRLGIPKEKYFNEKRIAFTPSSIKLLADLGFDILLESGAGKEAKFSDKDYSEAGAQITEDISKIYASDIIVKIGFPNDDEINLLKTNQILFSALNLPNLEKPTLELLFKKKITAFCFEYLKDDSGNFPIIQSMSEIAGRAAIFIASEYLTCDHGNGQILGGITGVPPTEIVVIGAGSVGFYATKNALALGASVKVFDNSLYRLRRLQNILGQSVYNSTIKPDIIREAIQKADVVIGAIRSKNGRTPVIVSEDMVMQMHEGAVIIDISIDQGGCFETSKITSLNKPTFEKHGVIHYCVPNVPSRVPRSASMALSNILTPLLTDLIELGSLESYLWEKPNTRNGIYIYRGILTNRYLGEKFALNSKAIDLLLTSYL